MVESTDIDGEPLIHPSSEYIRVIVTELCPRAYYKTLHITHYTTTFEVIVKLVQKYAITEEDKDPDTFYLTEV